MVQNSPFSSHFMALEEPKRLAMGSKWAYFTWLGNPHGLGSFLEEHIFDPFLSHFLVTKPPSCKALCIFRRAKTGHHGLKTCQKHLFWHIKWHPMWSMIFLEKKSFFKHRLDGPC